MLYIAVSLGVLVIILSIALCFIWRRKPIDPDKEQLVAIIESSDDAIVSRDLNGRIKSWNRGAEKLYGYSRQEAIGQSIKMIKPEEKYGELEQFNERIRQGERIERLETERLHKSGERIPVSLILWPIYDANDTITGISSIARNIGPRKQAEARLELATQRTRFAMESLPVGIIIVNEEGIIQYANPTSDRMFGYPDDNSEDDLTGQPLEVLVPVKLREHHVDLRQEFLKSPVARDMGKGRDLNGIRRDGSEFPVEIALTPLPAAEGKEVMATVVDITERKQGENELEQRTRQLERSNRELDSFAYVASHDLKSPLRGIHNLCNWIEEDLGTDVPEEVDDHLRLLRSRVERMEGLLEDLLQYSRIGREEGSPQQVDVRALVDNAIALLDPPPGFIIRIENELPVIQTLAPPLEQVFRNLMNNAIKHHDRSSGLVLVGARDCGEFYEFYIADDGPGIEPGYRTRIFGMFTTLQSRDDVEGSGLGLAMIAKIVEAWHGQVWVEDNEQGRGATFKFTWPKHIEHNHDAQEEAP